MLTDTQLVVTITRLMSKVRIKYMEDLHIHYNCSLFWVTRISTNPFKVGFQALFPYCKQERNVTYVTACAKSNNRVTVNSSNVMMKYSCKMCCKMFS